MHGRRNQGREKLKWITLSSVTESRRAEKGNSRLVIQLVNVFAKAFDKPARMQLISCVKLTVSYFSRRRCRERPILRLGIRICKQMVSSVRDR